ncbi:MAG: hypothetical protein IPH22_15360 [Nitrosomonas sp.]|nr:hypothetical protein [Nitrosomonas sp.]
MINLANLAQSGKCPIYWQDYAGVERRREFAATFVDDLFGDRYFTIIKT